MLAFLLQPDFEVWGTKNGTLGAIAPSPPPFSPCHRSAGQPKARPALWWQGEKGEGKGQDSSCCTECCIRRPWPCWGPPVHLLVPRAPIQALAWPTPHEAGPGGLAWALLWEPPVHLLIPRAPYPGPPLGTPPMKLGLGGPCLGLAVGPTSTPVSAQGPRLQASGSCHEKVRKML